MSTNRFRPSCYRCLLIASLMLGSFAARAEDADQLQAPTHRQARVIEPKVDGKTLKLHSIATNAEGQLLAAVGGQSMQYVMTGASYETKLLQQPSLVLLLDSEGQTLKQWELELTPSAITVAPDGAIYVGGSGRLAKLDQDGSTSIIVDSPHVGNVDELRMKTADSIRSSRERMGDTFATQIETLQQRVDKIEATDEADRTRLEAAQLKAFKTQLEMLQKLSPQQSDDEDEVEDSQLDAAMMRTMSVTSIAASDQDVFVCALDPSMSGYSIWRLDRSLDIDSSELIMEGLRGCCGQMDIQCCGENLLVSENTKFRVGIYDRHGRIQGKFGRRDRTSRAGFGSCCNPMNTLSMSDGSVLTAESSIGHIKRFDIEGNLVAYIGKATIGAGCKHCALGYDEKNDLYYMMYEDKNAICVMANSKSTPMTLAEKQTQQRQIDFLSRAAGTWSLKEDTEAEQTGLTLFAGGRGGSSRHAVSSLVLSSDGNAKILEGMYKAYGDKSRLELLREEESEPEAGGYGFALAIDQVRFLEGSWRFTNDDTAVLAFKGHAPITLARSSAETGQTGCAGTGCTNEDCKDRNCPNAGKGLVQLAIAETDVAKKPAGAEKTRLADPEIAHHSPSSRQRVMEVVNPANVKFQYKLLFPKDLGKNREKRLNEMGAEGWEYCGRVGKKMMFKRQSGLQVVGEVE